jgi:dihydroxyacetone kinase-like predicted kinase
MPRRACDGAGLLEAFRAAVANLEAHVDEINALNVYPVPDGDTGSNMFATVTASLEEAEATAGQPADRVAAAISFGALMGAAATRASSPARSSALEALREALTA